MQWCLVMVPQTRSFCYVDDPGRWCYRLLMSDYHLPVNISSPTRSTQEEFAEEVIALTGANQKIVYKPLPVDDPETKTTGHYVQRSTGMGTEVSRKEGLKVTYECFKSLPRRLVQTTEEFVNVNENLHICDFEIGGILRLAFAALKIPQI